MCHALWSAVDAPTCGACGSDSDDEVFVELSSSSVEESFWLKRVWWTLLVCMRIPPLRGCCVNLCVSLWLGVNMCDSL